MTGEPLIKRADDNAVTLKSRLKHYHSLTVPLIDFYHERGLHRQINAELDANTVFKNIKAIFEGANSTFEKKMKEARRAKM